MVVPFHILTHWLTFDINHVAVSQLLYLFPLPEMPFHEHSYLEVPVPVTVKDVIVSLSPPHTCQTHVWNLQSPSTFLVQSFSHVRLSVIPWTAACQVSLYFTMEFTIPQYLRIFGDKDFNGVIKPNEPVRVGPNTV